MQLNLLKTDRSRSPCLSKLKDPDLEKMKRHLKSCSKIRNLNSLTDTQKAENQTKHQKIEIDKALNAMACSRRELISFIQLNTTKSLSPENISEIRKKYTPKDYIDHINSKKYLQIKKYKDELLSRNPMTNAMYQIRALSKGSKRKIFYNLGTCLPTESRFNAFGKSNDSNIAGFKKKVYNEFYM